MGVLLQSHFAGGKTEAQSCYVPTASLPDLCVVGSPICMCSCACRLVGAPDLGARGGRASGQQDPLQQGRGQPSGLVSLSLRGPSHLSWPGPGPAADLRNLSPPLHPHPLQPPPLGYRQSIRIGSTCLSKRLALTTPEGAAVGGRNRAEPGRARLGRAGPGLRGPPGHQCPPNCLVCECLCLLLLCLLPLGWLFTDPSRAAFNSCWPQAFIGHQLFARPCTGFGDTAGTKHSSWGLAVQQG